MPLGRFNLQRLQNQPQQFNPHQDFLNQGQMPPGMANPNQGYNVPGNQMQPFNEQQNGFNPNQFQQMPMAPRGLQKFLPMLGAGHAQYPNSFPMMQRGPQQQYYPQYNADNQSTLDVQQPPQEKKKGIKDFLGKFFGK